MEAGGLICRSDPVSRRCRNVKYVSRAAPFRIQGFGMHEASR